MVEISKIDFSLFYSYSVVANQLTWLLLCQRINKPKSQKTTARRQTQTFLDCKLFHFSPRLVLYFALVFYFLSPRRISF